MKYKILLGVFRAGGFLALFTFIQVCFKVAIGWLKEIPGKVLKNAT